MPKQNNKNNIILAFIILAAMMLGLLLPAAIPVAASGSYNYSASITIDHTKVFADHPNFPLLFQGVYDGTAGEPDLRTVTNGGDIENTDSGGGITGSLTTPADLVFSSDNLGSTPYDFEVESYDPATGSITAWVAIPTMDASDDLVFYLVYGNSSITTTQEDIANVWDASYSAVYHMADGSATTVLDSTSNNNTQTKKGSGEPSSMSGQIGYGQAFDGVDDYMVSAGSLLADWGSSWTIESYVNPTTGSTGAVFSYGHSNDDPYYYMRLLWNDVDTTFKLQGHDGTNSTGISTASSYTAGSDYFAIARNNAGAGAILVNGSSVATDSMYSDSRVDEYDVTSIGSERAGLTKYFKGSIDELRVSSVARADTYLQTVNASFSPATFYTVGSAQAAPTPTPTATATDTPTPTATATATATLTPTPTATPVPVNMADPSVVISQDLIDEIEDAIAADEPNSDGNMWAITDIYTIGNYSMISLAALDVDDPNDTANWYYYNAIWTGTAIVRDNGDTTYTTGLDGDATYLTLLGESSFSNPNDGADQGGGGGGWIWFPFQAGTKAYYGQRAVHAASNALPGWKAVDFVGGSTYPAGTMPNAVYGSYTEPIKSVCRDGTAVGLTTENFYYLHLEDSSSFQPGAMIRQGQPIGSLVMGPFNDRCGWASQASTSYHLHWGFRGTGDYMEVETWVLNLTDSIWRRGSETVNIGGYLLAEWPDHTGPIPTLGPTITPGGPTPTPGPYIPDPRTYGGNSLWDPFIYGLFGMAKATAARFPEHTASGIGSQITSGAEIAIRVAFTMLTSNFDLTISLIIFGMIAAAEVVRLIYALYLGVKKLIPLLG